MSSGVMNQRGQVSVWELRTWERGSWGDSGLGGLLGVILQEVTRLVGAGVRACGDGQVTGVRALN